MADNTFYLTKDGLKRVQEDHERLLEFRRAKTMGEVPSILHSEEANPEYLAFQEDMSLLEAKIAEYENILNNVALIKAPTKDKRDVIALGAVVTLEMDGTINEFMIVGTMEADPAQKKISNESPIGKAILGAKVGSTVSPDTAVVTYTCKILKIRYS